jgi:hypothetical protein
MWVQYKINEDFKQIFDAPSGGMAQMQGVYKDCKQALSS